MESAGRQSRHIDDGEQIVVPIPQILEKIAEVIQSIPQERISVRTIEKIVHFPVPQISSGNGDIRDQLRRASQGRESCRESRFPYG